MTPSVISCTEQKKSNVKSTQGTATDNKTLSSYLPWMNFFQLLALTINNKKQRKLNHNIIFVQLGEVYLLMGSGEGCGANWRKVIWNLYDPPACQNSPAYYPRPNRIKGIHIGITHHPNIKNVTPGILNIVKHFTFEHNNSNQETMSALTWHQYKCYILIQKLHVQYYLIPSCVRITMTIRYVINFFSSSPYNYLLKTFNF